LPEVVDLLIAKQVGLNVQNDFKDTALTLAISKGHLNIANALIRAGADPDLKNDQSNTALIIASLNGYEDIVKALIRADATLDLQNEEGRTALMLAALYGKKAIVETLLNAGADPLLEDEHDNTALGLADDGPEEIIEALNSRIREISRANLAPHVQRQNEARQRIERDGPDLNQKEKCPICLAPVTEVEDMNLPCGHRGHEECLTPWIEENDSCPICKTPPSSSDG
jgi:ankyrin repeat protein